MGSLLRGLRPEQAAALKRDAEGNLELTDEAMNPELARPEPHVEVEHANGFVQVVPPMDRLADMIDDLYEGSTARQRARAVVGPLSKRLEGEVTARELEEAEEPTIAPANEHDAEAMRAAADTRTERYSRVRPESVGHTVAAEEHGPDRDVIESAFRSKQVLSQLGLALDDDEEEWHPDERQARNMPFWLFMESVREDLSYTFPEPERRKKRTASAALVRHAMVDEHGRAYATGGRKNAKAHVAVSLGDGTITVNGRTLADYFPNLVDRREAITPLMAVYATGAFDVRVRVRGGGHSGQAGAIKHGLARALARFDPYLRMPLKRLRLLQRDPRAVERKKIGRTKARRAFQWVKR